MIRYVALLRGVNLGKRQLKMEDLRAIADRLGYDRPRPDIASGNLVFGSTKDEAALKLELEEALAEHMGAQVGVMVRSADEMAGVAEKNPFAAEPGNRVVAIFLDKAPPKNSADTARNRHDETIALGRREL